MSPIERCSLCATCKFPDSKLRPRYKCRRCGFQLHTYALSCSDPYYGEDGVVQCEGG